MAQSVVMLFVLFGFIWSGESRCPKPTLPADPNDKYYQGFQKIPSTKSTADKLKKNLVRPGKGNGIKEDTVVVMDGSGSVGYCEFNKGRQALANLIKIGNDGGHDTRFACVTYSSGATTNFGFYPPAKASALMRSISYPNGGTNTQLGLAYAKTLMKGSRSNSRKIVLLVTDGQSNIHKDKTVPNAKALKDDRVEIYVVAVGSYIHGIDEMVRVASHPPEKFMFRVQKLKDFWDVVKLVLKEVSPGKYKAIQGHRNTPC